MDVQEDSSGRPVGGMPLTQTLKAGKTIRYKGTLSSGIYGKNPTDLEKHSMSQVEKEVPVHFGQLVNIRYEQGPTKSSKENGRMYIDKMRLRGSKRCGKNAQLLSRGKIDSGELVVPKGS